MMFQMMPPLRLTDSQLVAITDAAKPLPPHTRPAFVRAVADKLGTIADPGDGDVGRAIRAVLAEMSDRRTWLTP
jgi:hypothetical protein